MRELINFNFVIEVVLMYSWLGEDKTRVLVVQIGTVLSALRMFRVKRSTKEAFVVLLML